jgi:hypothetical protein
MAQSCLRGVKPTSTKIVGIWPVFMTGRIARSLDSGSEAVAGILSPSTSGGTLPIVAASQHGSLHIPADDDGDEAEKQKRVLNRRPLAVGARRRVPMSALGLHVELC